MSAVMNICGGWNMVASIFRKSRLQECFPREELGPHYILVIPTQDLVIVHRVDNEPPVRELKTVEELADHPVLTKAQFGHLVKLILDAQSNR